MRNNQDRCATRVPFRTVIERIAFLPEAQRQGWRPAVERAIANLVAYEQEIALDAAY